MHFFFTIKPSQNQQDESDKHTLIPIYDHEQNSREGSEFLDDAIRMHDQPLKYTEKDITGSFGDSF